MNQCSLTDLSICSILSTFWLYSFKRLFPILANRSCHLSLIRSLALFFVLHFLCGLRRSVLLWSRLFRHCHSLSDSLVLIWISSLLSAFLPNSVSISVFLTITARFCLIFVRFAVPFACHATSLFPEKCYLSAGQYAQVNLRTTKLERTGFEFCLPVFVLFMLHVFVLLCPLPFFCERCFVTLSFFIPPACRSNSFWVWKQPWSLLSFSPSVWFRFLLSILL